MSAIDASLRAAGFTEKVENARQVALRRLEHRDVLTSDENAWGFEIELIRLWIRQKQLGLKNAE